MASVKIMFRSHGDETKPPDFQMLVKHPTKKQIAALRPEQRRKLNEYLVTCEKALAIYKKDIQKALE